VVRENFATKRCPVAMLPVLAVHGSARGKQQITPSSLYISRRNVMGEILEIASFMATPLGTILSIAAVAALYFFGRWVLTDKA
jgi:hypothetical protein